MPIAGLGLHVIVAIFFAVHAVRSGQDRYWLFVLFAFPLLGSVVYAFAIWLPEMRHSREGQRLVGNLRKFVDPSRELRDAQEQLDIAATADNRLRLADALLGAGRASEAVVQYQAALQGVHAGDAAITVRYAHALLETGNAVEARNELDRLIRTQPNFKSPEGHLVYARAVAMLRERDKAREEFEVLIGYFAGLEARACYAGYLMEWTDFARARTVIDEGLLAAKRMPGHSREINQPWIDRLRELHKQLPVAQ